MYRALTLLALDRTLDLMDESSLEDIARRTAIRLESTPDKTRIWAGDREITEEIRSPRVSRGVSIVAQHPAVRREMVRLQREIARHGNYVIEGRDIGTVVFPDADVKVYMEAASEARASRRLRELQEKGIPSTFAEVEADILRRDELDSSREASPLLKPEDAIAIDTTTLTIEEQVAKIVDAFTKLAG